MKVFLMDSGSNETNERCVCEPKHSWCGVSGWGGGGSVNECLHGMRGALRKLQHHVGTATTSKTTNDKPILFYSHL